MLGFNLSVGRNRQSFGDADAQAFITATGLTGTTETTAVRRLVSNLKTYGLWSKMKAIYPFVSDTYNLVSYSEDFNSWIKSNTPVTVNAINSPTGTLTADKLVADTVNTQHSVSSSTITVTAGLPYTRSVYVKKGEYSNIVLTIGGFAAYNDWKYVAFNLDTNTFTGASGSTTYGYSDAGNGWVRIWFTVTPTTTGSDTFTLKISNNPNNTGQGPTFAGDGVSGLYVWGAQFQQSTTVTTYQPISTTSDARFVSQFKYNLKDPRDLDAAFRLAFNGTWAYSNQGATPNGVNGYANTYFLESANATLNSHHISYYSRNNSTGNPLMGASNGTTETNIYPNNGGTFYPRVQATNSGVASTNFDTAAYFIASRITSSEVVGYRNTSRYAIANATVSLNNLRTYYLGANNDGTVRYNSNQVAFSTIGNGLTDTEATNLYTSVQQFNQDLSRQVGVPIVSDADAQSFLNAAQITDLTQANAINTLVVGLKNASLWTKMKAIYPFVGGTATSHKWNLKDPRDLDAAYRLAFFGAWTHSSTGALPNGANAYANTYLSPSTSLIQDNTHISYYSRTNISALQVDIGSNAAGADRLSMELRYNGNFSSDQYNYNTGRIATTSSSSLGYFIASRTNSSTHKAFYNNSQLGSTNTGTSGNITLITNPIYLALSNGSTFYSSKQVALATIGNGLNDSEASTLYTLVQNFQTTLNRQVP